MGKQNKQRRAAKRRRSAARAGRPSGSAADEAWVTMRLWTAAHHPPGPARQAVVAELQALGMLAARVALAQVTAALPAVWTAGYGPDDLDHLLRRAGSAAMAAVAAAAVVADHHARGAPAGPWDDAVTALEQDPVATTPATLAAAVELLALLRRLPPVPPTRPRPWDDPAQAPLRDLDGRLLARVRALLRKAESTEFEAEAEALTAKAQQLITRHAIDEARLRSAGGTASPTATRRIFLHDPYLDAKALLVDRVATPNRCRAVYSRELGWCTVFGDDGDLHATDLLVASLLAQAVGTMVRLGPQRDARGRSRTRSFRNAFLQGFAVRIGERLTQATDEVVDMAADRDRVLPVLASRAADARAAADAAFPDLVTRTVGGGDNGAGWAAGMAAADLASLDVTAGSLPGR